MTGHVSGSGLAAPVSEFWWYQVLLLILSDLEKDRFQQELRTVGRYALASLLAPTVGLLQDGWNVVFVSFPVGLLQQGPPRLAQIRAVYNFAGFQSCTLHVGLNLICMLLQLLPQIPQHTYGKSLVSTKHVIARLYAIHTPPRGWHPPRSHSESLILHNDTEGKGKKFLLIVQHIFHMLWAIRCSPWF